MKIQSLTNKKNRLLIKERFDDNFKERKNKIIRLLNIVKSKFYNYKKTPANSNSLDTNVIINYNLNRTKGPKKLICYAPFKNMYFAFDGSVISCCYTRKNVLGKYPENNIKEIWFGEKYNNFRKNIENFDLSSGCEICKNQLQCKNYSGTKALLYDDLSSGKSIFPAEMEFELDNNCNLECIMCTGEFSSSIQKHRDKVKTAKSPYDSKFVNQLIEFIPYLKEVKFYGGEPFLINIYFDIWDKIIAINPKIKILVQTNATVLNNRIKAMMDKGRFCINVSLDAVNKETFETIRKNADYDIVMQNIDFFYKYSKKKKLFFGIVTTPIRQNWEELPAIMKFCNQFNVPFYLNTYNYPYEYALWNLKPDKIDEIYNYLSCFKFQTVTVTQKKNLNHYNDFLKQINAWKNQNKEGNKHDLQNVIYN